MKILTTLMTAGVLMAGSLAAQSIPARERVQDRRIEQGVRSGELTPREAAKLEHKEAQLRRQVRHARATGAGMSPSERRRIARKQAQLNRQIYREKHDNQVR